MSAQVTEAHKALTESVCELLDSKEMVGPSPAEQAAQLIADSEAKAVVEIAMVAAESADRNVSLRLERDQLRAELATCNDASEVLVESLRAEVEQLKEYSANLENDVKYLTQGVPEGDPLFLAVARAERAEAELHALRLVCGTTDADKFSTWVDRANARAEKAEAELAAIGVLPRTRKGGAK